MQKRGYRQDRKNLVDDTVLDDATRKALMADIQRGGVPRSQNTGSQVGAKEADDQPPRFAEKSSDDLLGVMCQRLKSLEATNAVLHKEIREKATNIISLQDHLRESKRHIDIIEQEKLLLAQRIADMNRFLADYNLSYVGDERDGHAVTPRSTSATATKSTEVEESKPFDLYSGTLQPANPEQISASVANLQRRQSIPSAAPQNNGDVPEQRIKEVQRPRCLPFHLDTLVRNAELLSASIGTHEAAGPSGRNVGGLQARETVPVCVYLDGLVVNNGPFRPYGWPLCDAFLNDLMEGYFPYEYKDRYPNGFLIDVVDKSKEECPKAQEAKDAAQAGGGRYKSVRTLGGASAGEYKALTKEELMERLSKQKITPGGQIVNPQAGVAEFLGAKAPEPQSERPSSVHLETRAQKAMGDPSMAGKVTSIQVKFPKGQKVHLHLFTSDTVGDLLTATKDAAHKTFDPSDIPPQFDLCTVFPRKTYDDLSMTLQEAGLFPNCQVLVKVAVATS